MKNKRFIETGRITAPHGIHGEVKIEPWADSPQFLLKFKKFYIDGNPYNAVRSRVSGKFVLVSFDGITTIEDTDTLRGKTVCIDRNDADLPEGSYFISDLLDMTALDEDSGEELGKVTDIISLPSGNVAEIIGKREILVPVRSEFIRSADIDTGIVKVHLIEGM